MLPLFAILFYGALGIQFTFPLKSKELKCFGEIIGQNSLVVGSVQANSSEYSLKIHVPQKQFDSILQYAHSLELQKFSFTTNNTQENYQFCIHNLANVGLNVSFNLATGMDAQDFSLVAQKEDLKPIEIHLKKLNGLINSVEQEQKEIEERQATRFSNVSNISYKIIIFSVGTLILMVLTNFVQARKLKSFFKSKKFI
ncbi:unnamed protein product (macronuclear) [Paramecium tetraurelia]|uniref:GOLD domain-containing protein n=1 Tax=Paramecium tetraurelia TaxID=5888 RepID=A0CVN6_PARTE|nr:uncharacterized protein GSPATT00011021001 [Paramecium tetraurelia]CAK74853.1 unnamed protein product [Paramecium tetraurelia]|eukprot:XP_001442250.1 hypothetical protein (macronuclear) [Paramecium tetraurelia strain d4-2]